MPLIRISHAAQYPTQQKAAIMQTVSEAYASASGCDISKVWVVLEEVMAEDWATGGSSLASKRAPAETSR